MNTDAVKLIKEIKSRSLQAIHSYTAQPLIKRNNVKSILSSLRERKKGRNGRKEQMNEGMKEGRSISCIKNGLAQFKLQPGLGKLDFTALLLILGKFKTVAIC